MTLSFSFYYLGGTLDWIIFTQSLLMVRFVVLTVMSNVTHFSTIVASDSLAFLYHEIILLVRTCFSHSWEHSNKLFYFCSLVTRNLLLSC